MTKRTSRPSLTSCFAFRINCRQLYTLSLMPSLTSWSQDIHRWHLRTHSIGYKQSIYISLSCVICEKFTARLSYIPNVTSSPAPAGISRLIQSFTAISCPLCFTWPLSSARHFSSPVPDAERFQSQESIITPHFGHTSHSHASIPLSPDLSATLPLLSLQF